jgi:SAM-dependent methyltransferase
METHWSKGWYYNIELKEGEFTDGTARNNLALTRKLLRNVDVRGKRCIDIGTAEAVIPVLLKRARADDVVAYDLVDSSSKVNLVKEVYQVDFEYVHSLSLPDLQMELMKRGDDKFFDLIVFSGVLYHLINPLGALALVRSFCKPGGLFLLETRTVQDFEAKMIFNMDGRFGYEFFLVTTGWLDSALRMVGLEPISAVYHKALSTSKPSRTAILCRSHAEPIPLGDERFEFYSKMFSVLMKKNYNDILRYDYSDLLKTQTTLDYSTYDDKVAVVNGRSLYEAISDIEPYEPSADETRLTLRATM